MGWRRETARNPARGGAGGLAEQGDVAGQVAGEEGVEQRLRLQRHDAGAGGDEGAAAVADMRADVEGEIAGGDDAAVEGGEAGDAPRAGAVDDQRAREAGPAAEAGDQSRRRSSQTRSIAKETASAAKAPAARKVETGGVTGGASSSPRTATCRAQTALRRREGGSGAASAGRARPAATKR